MSAKKRQGLVRLTIGFVLLVILGWLMGQYDYARLVDGKRPVFARLNLSRADGGSIDYFGLGYTVTDHHEERWGIELQTDVITNASYQAAPFTPYRVGPTLDYWTPFMSREQTRVIFETNGLDSTRHPRANHNISDTNR